MPKPCIVVLSVAIAAFATLIPAALAQPQPTQFSSFKPPVDHPVLHDVFLNLAGKLESLHAEKKAQARGNQLQQVDQDFARVLRITPSELDPIFQLVRKATKEIAAIEDQMRQHVNDRARWELPADYNTIRVLQERRLTAIQSNMTLLRTTLSAASWTGVSTFINTDLRNSTVIAQSAGAKP